MGELRLAETAVELSGHVATPDFPTMPPVRTRVATPSTMPHGMEQGQESQILPDRCSDVHPPFDASSFITGLSPTVYDTAWIAGLRAPQDSQRPRFPSALPWLYDMQHVDGSWGGVIRYQHDRVLCTLSALAAIQTAPPSSERHASIQAGTRYLWQHRHLLGGASVELVGFELLLPALVARAKSAGIAVPPHLDIYRAERAEKLKLIPSQALYSDQATIVHSIEFLGDEVDTAALLRAQSRNGSLGNSPAATAYFLRRHENRSAQSYLEQCMARADGAAATVLQPSATFEYLWAAYHLSLAGVAARDIVGVAERSSLSSALRAGGISLDPSFPIPDADDTAVALMLLHELEEAVDSRPLEQFALPDRHFVSFQHERHSSVGVNFHVLHALLRVPGFPERRQTMRRLLTYLEEQCVDGLYWIDKWHISPYYATSHALCVLAELATTTDEDISHLVTGPKEWLRQTQNGDGSWGFFGVPTAEETAYSVLALCACDGGRIDPNDHERVAFAMGYLRAEEAKNGGFPNSALPPMWIDKCLYAPFGVVRAVIAAARLSYARITSRA